MVVTFGLRDTFDFDLLFNNFDGVLDLFFCGEGDWLVDLSLFLLMLFILYNEHIIKGDTSKCIRFNYDLY